jgi:hypothetical protein
MKNELKIFEKFSIRRHFDEKSQKWFFSVVDVVAALTEQHDFLKARKYWNKLKERLVRGRNRFHDGDVRRIRAGR